MLELRSEMARGCGVRKSSEQPTRLLKIHEIIEKEIVCDLRPRPEAREIIVRA